MEGPAADPLPRHVRFGPFRLDTHARELRDADGALVALTGKAFDTLCCLIRLRDRAVGKDELLALVWPGRVVEDNNLTQAISALRRGLGDQAHYVVTVPGRGYQFVADVLESEASGAPTVERRQALPTPPQTMQASGASTTRGAHPRRPWIGVVIFAAVFVIAALAWRQLHLAAPSTEAAPPMVHGSVAVLPFRSLSPGPPDPLLEMGLAETLIARISSAGALRVQSLASTQRIAATEADPLRAARRLGAAYVVEGTTQRRGELVRLNARLLSVADGRALWSGTFDTRIERAFTLQDQLAAAVASALSARGIGTTGRLRSPCDGDDALAYRAYLDGRYLLDRPSAERMKLALGHFHEALDRDPTCARAYAGMAFAYRAMAMTGDRKPAESFALAKAAVARALAINPQLSEAYASQGFIRFWYDWDWPGAEASFQRAISLNPSSAEARIAYAHLLSNIGRRYESVVQARQAVALDPLSPMVNTLASTFLYAAGESGGGRVLMANALELEPNFWVALLARGRLALTSGATDRALPDLERARALCGGCSQSTTVLAQAYAASGKTAMARALLKEMEQRGSDGYVPATSLAAVHNALGDTEGALDLFERAYRERDVRMTFLLVDSNLDNLHAEPRFQALVRKLNLQEPTAAKP